MKKTYYTELDIHKNTIAIPHTFSGCRSEAVYYGDAAAVISRLNASCASWLNSWEPDSGVFQFQKIIRANWSK